jgi:hypothetical protein
MAGKVKNKAKIERIIRREMEKCVGLPSGALSRARVELKSAYHGEPYAVDAERAELGWSTYVDRSVMETVEWAKGPLLKVFAGTDDLIRFEPSSPEEEQYAVDASDYVNKVVFGRNAFDLVYGPLTDGLYQRVGWAKVYFDSKERREQVQSMEGLSAEEAEAVTITAESVEGAEAEVEITQDKESGLYSATVFYVTHDEQIKIMPLPSERIVYDADALTIEDARFCAHWEDKQAGELIEEGYSAELVKSLPGGRTDDYPEHEQQKNINADDAGDDDAEDGTRIIRVYEAYLKADVKGDGRLSRLKVTFAGDSDKYEVMDVEDWPMSRPPIFAACSLPLPYSPVGLSMADLVLDLQKLRTEMMRDQLDNMYLANHGEVVVNRKTQNDVVNMDQFMARRAGGVYQTQGDVSLVPLPTTNIASSALAGLELTDKAKEQRTGIGMSNQGLSADALQNTALGASILEDAQNQRIEMIARIYGETFYKPMGRYVLALAKRYLRNPVQVMRKGAFAQITPSAWDADMSVSVAVGLGTGSRQKQAQSVQQILALQAEFIAKLGPNSPVRLQHVVRAAHKLAEGLGFENPEQFFGTLEDAQKAEQAMAQEPPKPDPKMKELEIKQAEAQQRIALEREKASAQLQNDAAKIKAAMEMKVAELQQNGMLKQREMELEAELDAIKLATRLPSAGATEIREPGLV